MAWLTTRGRLSILHVPTARSEMTTATDSCPSEELKCHCLTVTLADPRAWGLGFRFRGSWLLLEFSKS